MAGVLALVGLRHFAFAEAQGQKLHAQQLALRAELHATNGRHGGHAADGQAAHADKVTQGMEDRPPLVALDGPQHMGAVPDHQVRTGVDHSAGEGHRVAPVFTQKQLLAIAMENCAIAFRAAMEGHHHVIGLRFGLCHQLAGRGQVLHHVLVRVKTKANHTHPQTLDLQGGELPFEAHHRNRGLAQVLGGIGKALLAEVTGMVVGHVQGGKPGVFQELGVARRKPEGIGTPGAGDLQGLAVLRQGAFQITQGQVCVLQIGLHLSKVHSVPLGGNVLHHMAVAQHQVADETHRDRGLAERLHALRRGAGFGGGCSLRSRVATGQTAQPPCQGPQPKGCAETARLKQGFEHGADGMAGDFRRALE